MSDLEVAFHKRWLGMLEPIEGLVVSIPVLVEAQCMEKRDAELSRQLADDAEALTRPFGKTETAQARREIVSLDDFFSRVLDLTPDMFARGAELPTELELYVPEGPETIRPSLALKKRGASTPAPADGVPDVSTPQSRAGEPFIMLILDEPGLDLDSPDRRDGHWAYPVAAKFDRLLRACRVPIGLLTNREELRLVYAPHGESSGSLTFRVGDLAAVGGRDILDAFVMLLSKQRFFGVAKERQLSALLQKSRAHQANVTTELADQVFEALTLLLRGFERAAERDGAALLEGPLARGGDHVYGGLLTVLLRLVFLLYAEDRDLLPTRHAPYSSDLSLLSLYGQLQADHAAFPDTMARRFGAWPRLLAVFRAVYYGARWGDVAMPPRRGELFDPTRYPWLEGWGPDGGAPQAAKERALLRVPTIDDETIYLVLDKLLVLDGQRLSYRALDVEQIGSVYEGLIGYGVLRLDASAVCLKPERVWVTAKALKDTPRTRRAAWLQETAGVAKRRAAQLAGEVESARGEAAVLEVLGTERVKGSEPRGAGEYVLQPGPERRRTSSHYTPKSLTSPIVAKTMEPILRALGEGPSADQLLALKICDPAMGSGAFLVETCRFLADQVVAAWSRAGQLEELRGKTDDVVLHARRLVAQRCLYGVDLNPFAVTLARLSMWLVTLAKDAPFTFVDHALRHGDSLVGLTLGQLRAFHWTPSTQLELSNISNEVDEAITEARGHRERILALAAAGAEATEEKERLLRDAEFALERARVVGDLVVAAFFSEERDRERRRVRDVRLEQVRAWFDSDAELPDELKAARDQLKRQVTPFHWSIEFPEIFYEQRPDPLDRRRATGSAFMDAFIGNTPFSGKNGITERHGARYIPWLQTVHPGAHGNADYCAHFFRRAHDLVGANGTLGFIATNTISQGDTRATSLHWLITRPEQNVEIYDAVRSMPWPGVANVAVSVLNLAKGRAKTGNARLDGESVPTINCRLRGKPERPDPVALNANANKSFQGSIVLGTGFILTPQERDDLARRNNRNAERTFPYLGGEEVNTSPTQHFDRYVINFGAMSHQEAEQWPDLLRILDEKVRPERERNNREVRKRYWWRFGEAAPALYAAIAPLKRCLVNSIVSKHVAFAFQPTDRIFSHRLCVFPFDDWARFAIMQSRMHEPWARLLSSTLEERLNYSPSDCFEPFPFPPNAALIATSPVDRAGRSLYEARAKYMVDTGQGLTQTYNKLKDPDCNDARVLELRRLHEAMDRAVLGAYGWDIHVPPYGTPVTADERRALEQFEDEVIDRLFALNHERAEKERRGSPSNPPPPAPRGPSPSPAAAAPPSSRRRAGPGVKKVAAPPAPARKKKATRRAG